MGVGAQAKQALTGGGEGGRGGQASNNIVSLAGWVEGRERGQTSNNMSASRQPQEHSACSKKDGACVAHGVCCVLPHCLPAPPRLGHGPDIQALLSAHELLDVRPCLPRLFQVVVGSGAGPLCVEPLQDTGKEYGLGCQDGGGGGSQDARREGCVCRGSHDSWGMRWRMKGTMPGGMGWGRRGDMIPGGFRGLMGEGGEGQARALLGVQQLPTCVCSSRHVCVCLCV